MKVYENKLYLNDINYICNLNLPWNILKDKSIMLSGATGLIGSVIIDVLMKLNETNNLNCKVYALVRNIDNAKLRFSKYIECLNLKFVEYDATLPIKENNFCNVDYLLHLASNTHPFLYSTDPISTITTNIVGVQNLLNFAIDHKTKRFIFASSNEAYGENRGDVEFFDEDYCGYINCNTLRAGYPESKRCAEALCQAYKHQKKLDIVIPRITRTFGPTMKLSDTKALSQFIKNGLNSEDIVLKSDGNQYYSYTYVSDAVSGLFYTLFFGKNGEAYNIAHENCDIRLKDLAKIIADLNGTRVIFEVPNRIESAGFSVVTKARLCGNKLSALGWIPKYNIKEGLKRTMNILRDISK